MPRTKTADTDTPDHPKEARIYEDLSMQEKQFFTWICCTRVLPFIAYMGNLNCWINIPGNTKGDFRQNYLYAILRSVDMAAKTAHSILNSSDFHNDGGRKETHTAASLVIENMSMAFETIPKYSAFVAYYASYSACMANYCFDFDLCNRENEQEFLEKLVNHCVYHANWAAEAASRDAGNPLEQIFINDCMQIKNKTAILPNDTGFYGSVWNNFVTSLNEMNCEYWVRLYTDIFAKGFALTDDDLKELDRRLNIPSDIRKQGAAAVAQYLS